ncbi:RsbRD N-terminal domain-containing protein [Solidesulfovibrio alcoholivorans]|uniref:RsbRD N-terminal domain-containing protein n=1 Tax=Solidesulfovibrio alcoholivorans TaxID=81406 RepID=UPI000494DAA7|nr:RsbRD N-terminal domain-containing protein [Solidesulfovibrio alcoholivorans]
MLKLADFLVLEQKAILDRWFDLIMGTYAENTAVLWKKKDDPFANPVRHKFEAGMRGIVVALAGCGDCPQAEVFAPMLDEIVRVRAVQDFTPSQATAFIYLLKKAVRETLWEKVVEHDLFVELLALESAIDVLALLAFDIYCQCRAKIVELRITQIKKQYDRLLKRANLVCDFSAEGEEP